MHSSQNAASKLGEANWSTREPGPTSKAASCEVSRPATPMCVTTTPFGRPVEPEV